MTDQLEPQSINELPDDGYIRIYPLARLVNRTPKTVRDWVKRGVFPQPEKCQGMLLFSVAEVKEWHARQPKIIA